MILDALAVLVVLVAIVSGATMLALALLRAPRVSAIRCGRCGTSAEQLTSFNCPTCGQDVRDVGLVAIIANSAVARFFKAAAITFLVLLAHNISTDILRGLVPSTRCAQSERTIYPTFSGWESLEVECRRAEISGGLRGKMIADLSLLSGRMTTLEVQLPSRKCWTIDEYGKRTEHGIFDEPALRTWMTSCGVDDSDAKVSDGIRAAHEEMTAMLSVNPPMIQRGVTYFSGGWGNRSTSLTAQWFRPAMLIGWAIVWLAGLVFVLRDRKRR